MVTLFQPVWAIAKLGRPNCPDDQGRQDKDAEAYRGSGQCRAVALVAFSPCSTVVLIHGFNHPHRDVS